MNVKNFTFGADATKALETSLSAERMATYVAATYPPASTGKVSDDG